MEERRSLGRGLEEISTQFLSTPSGGERFEELIKRVERLENEMGVKSPPKAEAQEAKPVKEIPRFNQIKNILANLHTQVGRDYIASGIIGSNGLHLAFDSPEQELDEEASSAYLAEGVNNTKDILDKLNLGVIQSLTITTHRCHILLRSLPQEKDYFLCLLIKRKGNIGLANLILEGIASQLSFT
jgi:predicted regulator of Ras-like GTPase activity (Roadblock/LC7/MglB family)